MRIPRLTLQAYKVYPAIMCFWNFHISIVWVYRRTLSGNGIPAVLVSRFDYENDPLGRRTSRIDTGAALDTYPTYGHQKSAKPKPMAQGGRDFKAVRMHGARSGIPRHSGNYNPNPEASPAFEAYGYNGRSEVTSSARYRGENTADTSKGSRLSDIRLVEPIRSRTIPVVEEFCKNCLDMFEHNISSGSITFETWNFYFLPVSPLLEGE